MSTGILVDLFPFRASPAVAQREVGFRLNRVKERGSRGYQVCRINCTLWLVGRINQPCSTSFLPQSDPTIIHQERASTPSAVDRLYYRYAMTHNTFPSSRSALVSNIRGLAGSVSRRV